MREALETTRESEYFTVSGLRTLTGLPEEHWELAVLKELIDNSLDAINDQEDKRIEIVATEDGFEIYDSGPGIQEEDLKKVYDFDVYLSSKRDYRTPTRGFQGNALKTVIGICHLKRWGLTFITEGKGITREANPTKRFAGIVGFDTSVGPSDHNSGVIVRGADLRQYLGTVKKFWLANLDVSFVVNGRTYPAKIPPIKRTSKTFVHWYSFDAFNELLQKVCKKDPERTVKAFSHTFSGAQRIASKLNLPYKRLGEFSNDLEVIRALYERLKDLTKSPPPKILDESWRMSAGKDALLKAFGVDGDHRYKKVYGEYHDGEGRVPFVVEGFLFCDSPDDIRDGARIITAINNSVPYDRIPFQFSDARPFSIGGKTFQDTSLKGVLDQANFTRQGSGLTYFLNFVAPHLKFSDKAKRRIISDDFKVGLELVTNHCCGPAIKSIQRSIRENRAFERKQALSEPKPKHTAKQLLMGQHFHEAHERASGGYSVTIRQIFYVLREIINREHDISLTQSDYSTLTQKVATEFMDRYPDLESKILFERRGFFQDPFFGRELPIGSRDVATFISDQAICPNSIIERKHTHYDLAIEKLYAHVLFIEKAGFNTVMRESGLVERLNIGVMSTQGFASRAARKLMRFFIKKGLTVYLLHDCDVAGYLIADKIRRGSATFKHELDVIDIGLTVADVHRMGLEKHVETVRKKGRGSGYGDALNILSEDERKFFVKKDGYKTEYRRVELNALTNHQFVELVEEKIRASGHKPVIPTVTELEQFISLNPSDIEKEALHRVLRKGLPQWEIDEAGIAKRVRARIEKKPHEHWTRALVDEVGEYKSRRIAELAADIGQRWAAGGNV